MFVESWVYYSSFFHTVELWIVYKWIITEVKEFIIAILKLLLKAENFQWAGLGDKH